MGVCAVKEGLRCTGVAQASRFRQPVEWVGTFLPMVVVTRMAVRNMSRSGRRSRRATTGWRARLGRPLSPSWMHVGGALVPPVPPSPATVRPDTTANPCWAVVIYDPAALPSCGHASCPHECQPYEGA